MNFPPSDHHPSDQMITWGGQNLAPTKSFKCNFCKRRFSNAQALGGHMNIHRKDRAKLKEFYQQNVLSLGIAKTADSCIAAGEKLSDEKKRQSSNDVQESKPETGSPVVEESLIPIPLFSESTKMKDGNDLDEETEHVNKIMVEFGSGDLDLELRLGWEKQL